MCIGPGLIEAPVGSEAGDKEGGGGATSALSGMPGLGGRLEEATPEAGLALDGASSAGGASEAKGLRKRSELTASVCGAAVVAGAGVSRALAGSGNLARGPVFREVSAERVAKGRLVLRSLAEEDMSWLCLEGERFQ